jgi:hypothetical protein
MIKGRIKGFETAMLISQGGQAKTRGERSPSEK